MSKRVYIDPTFLNRRKKKKETPAPRGLSSCISGWKKSFFDKATYGHVTYGTKLRANCVRLKGRNITVGNTTFSFDEDGDTEVILSGNNIEDYKLLLKMNGIKELKDS